MLHLLLMDANLMSPKHPGTFKDFLIKKRKEGKSRKKNPSAGNFPDILRKNKANKNQTNL